MNINSSSIIAGNIGDTVEHVLNGKQNESVAVLHGDPELVEDLDQLAVANGQKFGFWHFIISPDRNMTAAQWNRSLELHKAEFGWGERTHFVVRHRKQRANGEITDHIHILVENMGPDGRQLHMPHDNARNEKLSRRLEVEFGHDLIKGAHNRAVIQALEKEGHTDAVEAMKSECLDQGKPAHAQFSRTMKARAKRLGVDLPRIGNDSAKAKGIRGAGQALALAVLDQGVEVVAGDRAILMRKDGEPIGNVGKMFKEIYDDKTLLLAFHGELKKLQAERGIEHDEISRPDGGATSVAARAGQSKADGPASGKTSRSHGPGLGEPISPNSRGTVKEQPGHSKDGRRAGREGSEDHRHDGQLDGSNRAASELCGSAIAAINLNLGFKKFSQGFAPLTNEVGTYALHDYAPAGIPDPNDPAYVRRVFANFARSQRKAAESSTKAAQTRGYAPPL